MHELFKKCLGKAPYSPYRGSYFQGGGGGERNKIREENSKLKRKRKRRGKKGRIKNSAWGREFSSTFLRGE